MYKSPIILTELDTMNSMVEKAMKDVQNQREEHIIQVIKGYGVNVDKDELIKALQYDRKQYQQGFEDGIEKASEILAEVFGVPCNYADEWLPYACDFGNTCDCKHKECWKQFFKHYEKREMVGEE